MDLGSARQLWDVRSAWLNTAQYGIPPRPAHEALQAAVDTWRHGTGGPGAWGAATETARAAFAELVGAVPQDIVHGSATSQILGTVAAAVPDGARVVVPEVEFTSNLYPWLAQADRGVEVVTVPLAKLPDAIDARTWLVAFSLVQSAGGEVAPVADVLAAARQHGAMVSVDATQGLGWLPLDAADFDAVVCSCYKWLMAPRGIAFGYLSPRLRSVMRPNNAGPMAAADPMGAFYGPDMRLADGASRFDISPGWFAAVGAAASIWVLLDVGVERIQAHNVALANRFLAGLDLPPGESAIVSVDAPPGALDRLAAEGIWVSERDGRLRVACHVYTTEEDVDRAAAALRAPR
ncbi:aminotransferase class V-fold PLP-dependent enzyme [Marinitenerispora sediminis]|uniref:Aminotransferase n=1 Tax=Marinitenerispora sediminis TaxID=1931232 RepID=A0A368TAX9_9ACTN|nr:aminotransferase class V-fold PLP-dependent enzyme [Marinitenerispora sediminis]RCV55906.1 aminotransferase [Marinitenerispora sediminis]RCV61970.1 aminotransferase [Marinitenerispora sediminis]RCV62036.1 aminotransferase [Marinitenerispora sediminis]